MHDCLFLRIYHFWYSLGGIPFFPWIFFNDCKKNISQCILRTMKEAHTGRGLKRLLLLSFPHSRHLICNASLHPLAIKHFIHAQLIISMKKTRCLYMDILQGMRKLVLYGPSNYSCNVKLIQLYKKKQTSSEWIKPATLKFSWILLYIYIDKAANLNLRGSSLLYL